MGLHKGLLEAVFVLLTVEVVAVEEAVAMVVMAVEEAVAMVVVVVVAEVVMVFEAVGEEAVKTETVAVGLVKTEAGLKEVDLGPESGLAQVEVVAMEQLEEFQLVDRVQ